MASGTSKDDFSGGEVAIRFAKKLGFDVEALHLPSEAETAMALETTRVSVNVSANDKDFDASH